MNTNLNLNQSKNQRLPEAIVFRHLRMSRGLKVRQLADLLGISHTLICHYESGYQKIPNHRLKDLCKLFKVSRDELKDYQEGRKDLPIVYRDECILLIDKMDESKLKIVHGMLVGLSGN
ncbi:MAG: helix-turn-helix transcriptional regulator [Bdellovibrionaceae bacterium]|jgi:transcriptional regulator with XRE-family HTH domain|nr:helix-turn-helix transcriptional regulator [Pseudobdellovibrionaceae bacterium]